MCRLFAFRSDEPRPLERPLLSAKNALARQSVEHPDGWGIAHKARNEVRIEREVAAAHGSERFRTYVSALETELAIAHIRKASVGANSIANTHPFQFDGWVFAHNGTVRKFEERRAEFEKRIDRSLRPHLTGDTDSERCFFLFLTELRKIADEPDRLRRAARALGKVAAFTRATDPAGLPRPSVANFVATDGDALIAVRFGKMLHVAAPGASGPLRDGSKVRALYVSSEPTEPSLPWKLLDHGQGVAVDARMVLHRFRAE